MPQGSNLGPLLFFSECFCLFVYMNKTDDLAFFSHYKFKLLFIIKYQLLVACQPACSFLHLFRAYFQNSFCGLPEKKTAASEWHAA